MPSSAGAVTAAGEVQSMGSTNTESNPSTRSRNRRENNDRDRGRNRRGNQSRDNTERMTSRQVRLDGGRPTGTNEGSNDSARHLHHPNGTRLPGSPNGPVPPLDPPPGLGGGGIFGNRLTKDATNGEGELRLEEPDNTKEDGEDEICFICASPVEHHSVAPCNHRTCHICALRLRALYKTRACAHCRVSTPVVGIRQELSDGAARLKRRM